MPGGALTVTHQFVSTVLDDSDPDTISPSDWNQAHSVTPPVIYDDRVADTPASDLTDYAPTGIDTAFMISLNPSADIVLNSVAAQESGRLLWVHNTSGSFTVTVKDNTGATTANRIRTPNSSDLVLREGEGVLMQYVGAASRWRIVSVGIDPGTVSTAGFARVIRPEDYGTVGTADDTTVVQAAIDDATNEDLLELGQVYNVTNLTRTSATIHIRGRGYENTGFKAVSGTTGHVLSIDQGSNRQGSTLESFYVDLTSATGASGIYLDNMQFCTFRDVRVREGAVGWTIDDVAASEFDNCQAFNQRTSGVVISDTGAKDNTYRFRVYMTSGAAADMTGPGIDVQDGASHYFDHTRIQRTPGISFFMDYGMKVDTPSTTDWLFLNEVVIDGITDGTGANSATSAALYLKDTTGVFSTNSFFSANESSGQKQRGVKIDGGSRFSFQGGRISGSGLLFANTVDVIDISGVDFPANFSDAALNFASATVTNLTYAIASPGGAIADDNAKLSAATASTKGYLGRGKRMLVSDATAAESFILEHTTTGKTKRIRVNNGSTGTLEVMADNGTTKILQLTDSGRLHIGAGTNQDFSGTGSPESVYTATVGSTYRRTDGGADTTWYIKESGSGNTGWVAYGAPHAAATEGTGIDISGQVISVDLSELSAGGELGGTLDAPTVDATHSGSTHSAATDTHIADTSAAHAASAVSVDSTTLVGTGTDVQAVFEEVDNDIAALKTPDYLVGTATATLSGEIAVGTTPGGELGNTWASPTVDSVHSGSAHHDAITIGADTEHTLSGQVLSGADASTTQKGHVTIGSTAPPDVSTAGAAGAASTEAASKNHVHKGVASVAKAGSIALVGAVTLTGGTNVTLTQSSNDISIAAAGGTATALSIDKWVV